MGESEVRARVEPLNSVFTLQEGDGKGVNDADMSVNKFQMHVILYLTLTNTLGKVVVVVRPCGSFGETQL